MARPLRILGVSAMLLALGIGSGLLHSAAGESPHEKVTSDTLSYCRQLAARVSQLESGSANPPLAVTELSVAGKDMCERGSVRAGILRLRSAIVLMMHNPSTNKLDVGETE